MFISNTFNFVPESSIASNSELVHATFGLGPNRWQAIIWTDVAILYGVNAG